jgi:hypothetical protein
MLMTWGEFKRLVDSLTTDEGVIASIDWEQQPFIRIKHVDAGIAISGATEQRPR